MEYDKSAMTTLFHDLQGFRKALTDNARDMADAGSALAVAWEGNEAYHGFQAVHKDWDTKFEDTLVILDNVAAAVESALHRALGTDGKIGDGFAGV
ncbi:WXG100 family type VII secretion target [Nocardia cyriacigeorgica]|uniref:WXG100 family type VII secretion target n=1 Tax=Nocardia cyriacigeorgica TaxID=135487 RepID=UPI0018952B0F|nr:type VII secretion protein EsxR [Nocardia cyriacigeorgica]MBF6456548.1 type VII secretion protein EsxR [Nocardia cyriacigeorgica]MBF6479145.1 type VII secretion protein EsxR [Nocardia cyriacigeorgica]MBF6551353.1 type VII secretion protein EsxR [Nocardia cyriacigeorgica]